MRLPTIFAAVALLLAPATTLAAKDDAVPVTIRVLTRTGEPITTATIRHPEEKSLHAVNTSTGEWTETTLYLENGKEIKFVKDFALELEISAPGFASQHVRYLVRKRKNIVPVMLQEIQMEENPSEGDVQVQFKRDRPLE